LFEPRPEVRGIIARTYLYFQGRYRLQVSKQQNKLFTVWDDQYPVTKEECEITRAKAKIQGWTNQFVEKYCR
jgi:deoxyribonuclease-1